MHQHTKGESGLSGEAGHYHNLYIFIQDVTGEPNDSKLASWLKRQSFWFVFGRDPFRISAGTPTVLAEVLSDFSQSSKKRRDSNKLGHRSFLQYPF
jgi:hypothetical protein